MQLYSTKNPSLTATLAEAVFQGLPPDNGLYMPTHIPQLPQAFFDELLDLPFQEIAFRVSQALIGDDIPDADLRQIINKAINFPAPIESLREDLYVLELFHGPSLAFKDFGARFMAQLMSYFNEDKTRDLTVLVATSGDTGGAVAAGFYQTPGIKVVILYPSGKVSPLQEKQLTTLGHNIHALEVEGTFDDCQAMVKEAFLDEELRSRIRLSSANSINISRLIPQAFYYFEAYKQVREITDAPVSFCIPSGNFGNLTAGLLAYKMGLPVQHFIAATNANDVVPAYLRQGEYSPRPSVRTLSNAMDVGNPSNFARMVDVFATDKGRGLASDSLVWQGMKDKIMGFAFDDKTTSDAILRYEREYSYIPDPHGAVGLLAFEAYHSLYPGVAGIVLETAHPAKFKEDMERILGHALYVPQRLAELEHNTKVATLIQQPSYHALKDWLLLNA